MKVQVNEIKVSEDQMLAPVLPEDNESQLNWIGHQEQLQYARIVLNKRLNVVALVDSGASVCAIDYSYCVKNKIPYFKDIKSLKGATTTFETKGIAHLLVKIGPETHMITAEVVPLATQIFIFGHNYFSLFGYRLVGPIAL